MSHEPVRLHKKDNDYDFMNNLQMAVEAWVLSHATLCLIVLMCLLMALFVTVIFIMTGVSATDSGVTYNQFDKIV